MKIVKIVNKGDKYVAKNGKEYTRVNYYLVLDNGKYVSIRPSFSKGYTELDSICEVVINGLEK